MLAIGVVLLMCALQLAGMGVRQATQELSAPVRPGRAVDGGAAEQHSAPAST